MPVRPAVRPALVLCAGLVVPLLAPAQAPDPVPPPPVRAASTVLTPAWCVYETANYRVEAPDAVTAKAVGDRAEECRKTVALAWLGRELPAWDTRCPVRVELRLGPPGGATWFTFARGAGGRSAVATVTTAVSGDLDVILKGVVPHEVTHGVLTCHFGRPVPRWADEGLAILSEAEDVQLDNEENFLDLQAAGRSLRVKTLFGLTDYPRDMISVYLQGHSVARFLVSRGAKPAAGADALACRQTLLRFLDTGLTDGWDAAAKAVYGFDSVDALEEAWAEWLRARQVPPGQ